MKSRDVIKAIQSDGWFLKRITGSHHHFGHATKPGIVTVPHPERDLPAGTLRSIERQAGIRPRETMRYYVALVHKDADSDFGVSFPDFPGCVSAGSTLAEAASMASEALHGHADLMASEGHTIPEPSTLDAVMEEPENRDGIPVMVALARKATSRVIRVNITVPEDVLQAIDAYAEREGMNRSGFLVRAARREMDQA